MIPEAREVRLRPKIRKVLEARCRAPSTPQGDLKRAQIVLLAAEGRSTRSIAKEVGVQPRIVSKWRHRFADHGLAGLNDRAPKPIYNQATNRRILALLDKPPPSGYARWTGPLLAMALQDVDVQYVWRFLREQNIDLAARKSWCESNDPEFAAKAADVVGLYIDPPAKAIVLCVDEKPSIQALERAQGYNARSHESNGSGQSTGNNRAVISPMNSTPGPSMSGSISLRKYSSSTLSTLAAIFSGMPAARAILIARSGRFSGEIRPRKAR